MKTVEYYRNLGLVFVNGDFTIESDGSSNRGDSGFDVDRYFNQDSAFNTSKVESFAWRNNEGAKPDYKGDKEIELRNGKVKLTSSLNSDDNEDWSILCASSDIVKWRPVVLQSESPTVSPKEDKTMKPIYTAEMHAKGELPPVGAECILTVNNEPRPAKVTYIGKDIVCCSNVDGGAEYACLLGVVSFKPIIKTIKVNGFDVPAPMSEAPDCGSEYFIPSINNDEFFDYHHFHGDSHDKRWLSRGMVHSTESAAIAHAKAMLGIDPNA